MNNILNSTKIKEYYWKDDKEKKPQIGVIDQELYKTFNCYFYFQK